MSINLKTAETGSGSVSASTKNLCPGRGKEKEAGRDRYITLPDKERPNDLPRTNFFLRKIIGIRLLPQTLKVEIPD